MENSKKVMTRIGLWIDDDSEFLEKIKKNFAEYDNFKLETSCDPYAVDWLIRTIQPHFVVFDLRWLDRERIV